jgi:hypothetical protein
MVKKNIKRGGSQASQNVYNNVIKSDNCAINKSLYTGELPGTIHNFHLTTGGGKRKRSRRRRTKKLRGGSDPSKIVLHSTLSQCSSYTKIPAFPKGGYRKKRTIRKRIIKKKIIKKN